MIADGIKAAHPRIPTPLRMTNEVTHQITVLATMFRVFYKPGQIHFATVAEGPRKTNEASRVNFNQGQREGQFAGVIFGVFDLTMLIRSAFGEKRLPVEFELHCGPAKDATTRVDGRPFASDGRSRLDSWSSQSWHTRPYHYRCYTTPEFEAQSPRRLVWLVSGSTAVVTLALAAFVHLQSVTRARAESIAVLREEGRAMVETAGHGKERLSRDLHDGAVQAMYASILTLKRAMNDLESDPAEAREKVASSVALLDEAISELRGLLINLSPTPLAGEVLVNSLKTLVHTMSRANGTTVVLEGDTSSLEGLKSQSGVELLNLLREAISNAVRHAGARMVTITLSSSGGHLQIEIKDDGCGFDPVKTTSEGHSLANMKSRCGNLGATFEIESALGNGTTIRLRMSTG